MADFMNETARIQRVRQYHFPSLKNNNPLTWFPILTGASTKPQLSLATTSEMSPDTTLTALLQLITIKLSMQRAIVSLVDRDHQYFIAEATRTANLLDPSVHEREGDQLWMGCNGSTTRGEALCVNTLMAEDRPSSYPSFVVTDLREDPRFCNLPYVAGAPHFRFYAGTPLVTQDRYRIGSVFVIDDRAQSPPNENDIEFLGIMAGNIMNYLETQKSNRDQFRQMRMSQALAAFVEGKSVIPVSLKVNDLLSGDLNERTTHQDMSTHDSNNCVSGSNTLLDGPDGAFSRASCLLREALDADCTVLFNMANDPASPAIIAASSSDLDIRPPPLSSSSYIKSGFLSRLCQRHYAGTIWRAQDDGSFVSDDEKSSDSRQNENTSLRHTDTAKVQADTQNESVVLRGCFPKALQILFVPLWDSARNDHTSACFVTSSREVPMLTAAVEVAFVRAFTNSLTVICGRISATLGEQQKAEFISSMSHELRTPLHGIVASMEMLRASSLDRSQQELCRMVDVCGQTLLETISQVLDFNKINTFLRKADSTRPSGNQPYDLETVGDSDRTLSPGVRAGSSLHKYSSGDMVSLCEQALDVVVASFASAGALTSLTEMSLSNESIVRKRGRKQVPIHFIVDYANWQVSCSPGAIRRIIMNLISNSLRFTEQGWIRLELKLAETKDELKDVIDSRGWTAIITVTDTGQGMSPEFQRTRLFQPFAKADTAISGSGLGLSLVSGIVKSLDGSIAVESQEGQGTMVQIKIPLRRIQTELPPQIPTVHWAGLSIELKVWCHNKTYFIDDPAPVPDEVGRKILVTYLSDWFGLQEAASAMESDFVFFADDDLNRILSLSAEARQHNIHAIMLTSTPSTEIVQLEHSPTFVSIRIMMRPVGPSKLSRALQACLETSSTTSAVADSTAMARIEKKSSMLHLSEGAQYQADVAAEDDTKASRGPAQPAHRNIVHPLGEIPQQRSSTYRSRQASILCVDDNPVNLSLLGAYNNRIGCGDIVLAEDGLQAFHAVEKRKDSFDIIFMDLTMPICDGFESTRLIRELESKRRQELTPGSIGRTATIIAFTGLASKADQVKAFAAGVDHFVTKPLRFADFKKLVHASGLVVSRA